MTDLSARIAAHKAVFAGPIVRHRGLPPSHMPMPETYEAVCAELQATREELGDCLAEHENLFPMLVESHEANTRMSREFEHMFADRERVRDERDELAVELADARDEASVLAMEILDVSAEKSGLLALVEELRSQVRTLTQGGAA